MTDQLLDEPQERVTVVSEPLTYRQDVPYSYVHDLIWAERGSNTARERLNRHMAEVGPELARRDRVAFDSKPTDVEFRTNPNRTPGYGGNFAPPLWLIDRFAGVPRPKRVLGDLLPQFPLPSGVQSVNVPRLTVGDAEQPVSDLVPDPSVDVTDAAVSSEVVTISGHGDVALQLLDQSPPGAHLDWAFFRDLSEAYDAQLEMQLINGSGAAGQLTGLLQLVPSANQVTYAAGTPTAPAMFTFLGQMIAHIGNNRLQPPEYWLMRTARSAWIATSEDSQNRPLLLANTSATGEFDLATFAVKLDDAIPATLGPGGNQDAIILCRPSDGLLLESTPRMSVIFDYSGSGELQARIHLHRYVAALLGRYPSGISAMQGTGLVVQSGFSN